MNEQFTNKTDRENEAIAQKMNQVAEQTRPSVQFTARLEEELRNSYQPKTSWLATFAQVSPTLRWVALMILLALVLSWSIKNLIPAPQPAINDTPAVTVPEGTTTPTPKPINITATPGTQQGGYDFRGAKLFLRQPLPESPEKAHVYLLKKDEPAKLEQAQALADRFGIQGDVYTWSALMYGHTDYVFSDGKQLIEVYSNRYFTYTSNIAQSRKYPYGAQSSDHAEATIHDFLKARGLDFAFSIVEGDFPGMYILKSLAPDSIPMQYESFTQPVMRVGLDENGEVLTIDAALMDYDTNPVGEYRIISAEEALQRVLNDNAQAGKMEFIDAANGMPKEWYRSYPDNQPVTVYGYIALTPALDSKKSGLILLDGVPVTGNTSGLESLENSTFIKASGQYTIENGIRRFNVESWDRKIQQSDLTGTLSRQGDRVILTRDDDTGQQVELLDPPADLPFDTQSPDTQLTVYGVFVDQKMFWTYIQFFENNSHRGGGGSNGLGFYKINLSGAPVPFPPSPTPQSNSNQWNVEYLVQEGDTIFAIAEAFGITPEKIIQANSWLEGGVLTPGKALVIPVEKSNSGTISYKVRENDTLASIALSFGISVDELMQANNITQNVVTTGQTLVIPMLHRQASTTQPVGVYTIQEGDTLNALAQKFGTTVDELMRLNNLTDSSIYVGQALNVPLSNVPDRKIENLRGFLSVSIHTKSDGTTSKEYELEVSENTSGSSFYQLDAPNISKLEAYTGLPIIVSGTMSGGMLRLESYQIPYPNLQFQIVKGTQKADHLEGQNVIILTTEDGKSYVETLATTNQLNTAFVGQAGDVIQEEILVIPDETFGGLPVAHTYQSAIYQESNPPMEIRANKIPTYNDGIDPGSFVQPNLTIEQVELAYYVSDPYYQVNNPDYNQRSPYIQPVWHFHGHYNDGTAFDVLVQALKEEFLLPELGPNITPG